ncbi:CPBP family intramembrane metalloprotease [Luteolibacter sp. SL250]|uniref:CPBP family intramembrane glutamic endopeptidase n=1 Tax=Luteolibacter sp. SL250 TaxID=2995170 RepID=UPI00226E2238|nr:CPBP family intramembrane glutamic endopeptidase [Luteolibacter sp. SL250]WAC19690.1 CPBP family intramembrane metalloprotease [Luteolibacter sp. SL250]
MRGGAVRDVLKVWIYAAAVVAAGAWVSPVLYDAGKALGEITSVKRTNGFLEWMGRICEGADFRMFFLVSVIGMALVLFIPFAEWLSMKREARGRETGQPLQAKRGGVLEWGTGLLLAAGLFLLMGYGLVATGSFVWEGPPKEPLRLLQGALPWLVAGVVLQEWLFRGVALGIFLRAMKPIAAISMAAVLFTVVAFLSPPADLRIADPDASGVGFELLGLMARRLADPAVLLGNVLPLLAAGWVLGYARWRTASLWLPVGLQMGWILANVLFQAATRPVPRVDPLARLMAGDSLMHGFIPLAGVLVVGALVYFVTDPKEETLDGGA